jgi:hypothetical protein
VLAAGKSLTTFSFESSETPAQLSGLAAPPNQAYPQTTSFVYSGAPFSDSGYQFTPSVASVPEPSTAWLVLSGIGAMVVLVRRRAAV